MSDQHTLPSLAMTVGGPILLGTSARNVCQQNLSTGLRCARLRLMNIYNLTVQQPVSAGALASLS